MFIDFDVDLDLFAMGNTKGRRLQVCLCACIFEPVRLKGVDQRKTDEIC